MLHLNSIRNGNVKRQKEVTFPPNYFYHCKLLTNSQAFSLAWAKLLDKEIGKFF